MRAGFCFVKQWNIPLIKGWLQRSLILFSFFVQFPQRPPQIHAEITQLNSLI